MFADKGEWGAVRRTGRTSFRGKGRKMKQLMFAGLVAVIVGGSSGCCALDRIFHCQPWWYGPCGGCGYGDCGGCGGGCSDCGGGCSDCGGGCSDCGGDGYGYYEDDGYYGDAGGGYPTVAHAGGGCKMCGSRLAAPSGPPGPPGAQVTYPYYTNRGPRDFLARRPSRIGP